jgi:hypothetical protein
MNKLSLMICNALECDRAKDMNAKLVGASVLALDTRAFSALTTKAWCGGPDSGGLSGFDDSRVRRVCPGYGQMN